MKNFIRLPLNNAYNVRDLGGYACDGGVTRWHAFVRADGLDRLDAADLQFLKDYGINTVIDLRSDDELAAAPDPDELKAFADYQNISLIPGVVADVTKLTNSPPSGFLAELYLSILKNGYDPLNNIMKTIANARDGGVLFHCAAGKDRTGIVAALLLIIAGVAESDILSNYEVTHTYIRQNPIMMANTDDIPIEYLLSCREYLQSSLDYIENLGGIYEYFHGIGVEDTVINKIKSRIVQR